MLPFFLVGVAIPVFLYGFSGDGPPDLTPERYSPVPAPALPAEGAPDTSRQFAPYGPEAGGSWDQEPRSALVAGIRSLFERLVDRYVSRDVSPATIKLVAALGIFGLSFVTVRLLFALIQGSVGSVIAFLIHKAAAPMFMGFLAVGSTWGIHQTIAEEFGMNWAATTVTLTAAVATLFALAGVRIR
jgi:hypothetical protein